MSNSYTSSSRYVIVFFGVILLTITAAIANFALPPAVTPTKNDALWSGTMRKEKNRIANEVAGPRILVFGGSDVYFGISGERLTAMTGLPSFNMGTHAGQGLGIQLNNAMDFARPGDIVVIEIVPNHLFSLKFLVTDHAKRVDQWLGGRYFRTASLLEKLLLLSNATLADFAVLWETPAVIKRDVGYWRYPPGRYGDAPVIQSDDRSRKLLARRLAKYDNLDTGAAPPASKDAFDLRSLFFPRRKGVDHWVGRALKANIQALENRGAKSFYVLTAGASRNNPLSVEALREVVGDDHLLVGADHLDRSLLYDSPLHPNALGRDKVTRAIATALCSKITCRPLLEPVDDTPQSSSVSLD